MFQTQSAPPPRPHPSLIEAEVSAALEDNRITLAFQPVVLGADTAMVAFHEGLLRLRRPHGGLVSAGAFMPAVEDRPLGRQLDVRALQLGLAELGRRPTLRLAVNATPQSLRTPQWWHALTTGLAAAPDLAERLIVEVTECSRLTTPDMPAIFDRLRGLGLSLALDDFGAGSTCFSTLRALRFDILKIDGQYSRDVERDRDNQVLFDALLGLARHFDLLTVAESVESHAQAAYLASRGVDCLQGYAFGRPGPRPSWPIAPSVPCSLGTPLAR
ncbi:EAL domain-containing protein [Fluviibacterium sp. S390]|uniref:EAL domain-containing protein n=1 Tax=Fluviibacterium sp. S390 TaxID=3415139 RepID=UPI003C7C99E8